MSVIVETSEGAITIDLYTDSCPTTCLNFLKLCKIKYYNNNLFFNVQQNFIAQTGDPTGTSIAFLSILGTGKGGTSIFGKMYIYTQKLIYSGGPEKRFFADEIDRSKKHTKV